MARSKINCWEYMRCGREPGSANAYKEGVCPAAADESFDGINSGRCAGRFCWAVTGTFCGGEVQGTFARKRSSCIKCHFYQRVQAEEGTANLRTRFLRFITPDGSLLKGMGFRHFSKGTRFIKQGDTDATAYIIQRGACIELVEKDGDLHPIGHSGEGDVVGMIALLTGEPQTGHVEAETDVDVWVIDRAQFNDISHKDPDLVEFLTELVADRFDSKRPTASRTIGPYVATDIIGRGGYSIVYKGIRLNGNKPVAIKMLRHHLALQQDFLENFRAEASIISDLRHESIIQVYDMEERYRTVFIIMEYLEGQSVKDLLSDQQRFASDRAICYLRQACEALAHAHAKGLIHRDINPSNMMVLSDERLKLIDFGLACPDGSDDMEMGGALPYMAPELLDGEPADTRSDVYALGLTAFELVTGKKPHETGDLKSFMQQRKTQDIPDPIMQIPDLSQGLRHFILKACHRDSAARYQDAGHALQDLIKLG